MTFPAYPNSPFPNRPAMEVIVAYGRFSKGQIFWPNGIERELLLRRGWVKFWEPTEAAVKSPVDRMMRTANEVVKKRGRKAK